MPRKITLRTLEKAERLYNLMEENVYYSRRKLSELIGVKAKPNINILINILISQGKLERVFLRLPNRNLPVIVYRKIRREPESHLEQR
jgi:hypothetical protein